MKILYAILLLLAVNLFAGVDFDGSDDFIDAGTMDVSGSAMTIACWIYIDDFDNTGQRIISKASGSDGDDHYWMVSTYGTDPYYLRFRLRTGSTTTALVASSGALSTGTWTHVIAWYDGNDMKIYKDGSEVATTSKTGSLATDNTVHVDIGRNPDTTNFFDGQITDMAIWNTALDASERSLLYNSKLKRIQLQIDAANLQVYWPLDDESDGTSCDGDAFIDMSGNGNTGTGDDGAGNDNLTGKGEEILHYP